MEVPTDVQTIDNLLIAEFENSDVLFVEKQKHKHSDDFDVVFEWNKPDMFKYLQSEARDLKYDRMSYFSKEAAEHIQAKREQTDIGTINAKLQQVYEEIVAPLNIKEIKRRAVFQTAALLLYTLTYPVSAPIFATISAIREKDYKMEAAMGAILAPFHLSEMIHDLKHGWVRNYRVRDFSHFVDEEGPDTVKVDYEDGKDYIFNQSKPNISFPNKVEMQADGSAWQRDFRRGKLNLKVDPSLIKKAMDLYEKRKSMDSRAFWKRHPIQTYELPDFLEKHGMSVKEALV